MCEEDDGREFDPIRDFYLIDPYAFLRTPTDKLGKWVREQSRRRDAAAIARILAEREAAERDAS